jgi:tetratricopeptide (TPR) repeat protein
MSYIHEALKKAQREKEALAGRCTRILSKQRFANVLSKGEWLIPLCAIAAAFAFSSFSWFVSMGELASNHRNQSIVKNQSTLKNESVVRQQPVVRKSPVIRPPETINRNPILNNGPVVTEKTVVPRENLTEPGSSPIGKPSDHIFPIQNEQIASSTRLDQSHKLADHPEKKPTETGTPSSPHSADLLKVETPQNIPLKISEQETTKQKNSEQNPADQNASETLYNQALVLQKKGRLEEAKNLYEAALKEKPNLVTALNNLGAVYVQQNNLEEARKVLEKAIRISPQYADAYYNLACLHAQRKDLARSMFYLKKSISMNPTARQWARTDEDLKNLREHSEYEQILGDEPQS